MNNDRMVYRDGCAFYSYFRGFNGVRIEWAEVNSYMQAIRLLKGLKPKGV